MVGQLERVKRVDLNLNAVAKKKKKEVLGTQSLLIDIAPSAMIPSGPLTHVLTLNYSRGDDL